MRRPQVGKNSLYIPSNAQPGVSQLFQLHERSPTICYKLVGYVGIGNNAAGLSSSHVTTTDKRSNWIQTNRSISMALIVRPQRT